MVSDYFSPCCQCILYHFVLMILVIFWIVITFIIFAFINPFAGLAFIFAFAFFIPFAPIMAIVNRCERFCERMSLPLHSQTQRTVEEPARGQQQAPRDEALPTRTPCQSSLLVRRTIQNDDPPVTCLICLDDVQVGEDAAGSPNKDCIHKFHPHCISEALARKTTCPACAREFFVPDQSPA